MTNETPGQTLKRLRLEKSFTRRDVAIMTGATVSAVGHWERDHVAPSRAARQMLALLLGMQPSVWAEEQRIVAGAK